jgi:hypothetical protein
MLQHYSELLHATSFGLAVGGDVPWLWPLFETLHFIGLALLIGVVGTLDLRILGVGKGLPIGPLQQFALPWGMVGFVINLVTGIGFYAGSPDQYTGNVAFWAKMLFIALAGVNLMLFYSTGLSSKVERLESDQDAPTAAKVVAATSLFLWLGVIFWGRMLPFIGDAF